MWNVYKCGVFFPQFSRKTRSRRHWARLRCSPISRSANWSQLERDSLDPKIQLALYLMEHQQLMVDSAKRVSNHYCIRYRGKEMKRTNPNTNEPQHNSNRQSSVCDHQEYICSVEGLFRYYARKSFIIYSLFIYLLRFVVSSRKWTTAIN